MTSAQVLLTFFDMSARTHYLNARQTLRRLLDWRVVPVINENDTTTTDEISFGDNDFLAAQVAILIGADLLVLLTDIDGLYTADPRTDPSARAGRGGRRLRGPRRARDRPRHLAAGLGRHALEGRRRRDGDRRRASRRSSAAACDDGGAAARCSTAAPRARASRAQQARYSSFKLWLRYAKPSHGTVVVDAGAARALREGGTSLLPVGIVDVRGGFDAGDAVHVAEGAAVIGKGITNYSADRAAPGHGHEERPGARGPAAGHRRGRAPRLLRLGVIGRWPPPPAPVAATAAGAPSVAELCLAARDASRALAALPTGTKDAALHAIADALEARTPEILEANARDMEAGRANGLDAALLDRLALDAGRVRRWPTACARSRRCPTRSARSSTASGCPTASTCARCASRSASSRWSTRRGRTSRSMRPRCA